MNTTIAIVLALGGIAGALYLVRRKAAEEGVSMCGKLGAAGLAAGGYGALAGPACSLLDSLGVDGKLVGGAAKGITKLPSFVGGAITGSIEGLRDTAGLGGDGDACTGTWGFLGFSSESDCQAWKRAGSPNLNDWHRTH